jgi:hypothetical protein
MTHPQGAGTVNLTLNLLHEERMILGRLATEAGLSIRQFLCSSVAKAIVAEHPEAALRLKEARRQRRAAVLLVCGFLAIGASFLPDAKIDLRRPSSGRSIARVLRVNRTEAA